MKHSILHWLSITSLLCTDQNENVKSKHKFKLKGSHENAKPLPKRKKCKKRGY